MTLFLWPLIVDTPSLSWWVLPLIAIFLLISGGRERLIVEAREGLKLGGMQGRVFTASFGGGMAPPRHPETDEADDVPGVIDVEGSARVVDDERSLPS